MSRWLRNASPFRALVTLALAALLLAGPALTAAQDASPEAGGDTWVGKEPDLAAMPNTPADLEALGLPGFGRFFNGFYNDPDLFIEGTSGFYGQPVEVTREVFARTGLTRMYGSGMGLPSVPGEDSPPVRVAYTNLIEIEHPDESGAWFDYISGPGPETDAQLLSTAAPPEFGDPATIVNYTISGPDIGGTYSEYYLMFQVDTLIVETGFTKFVADGTATPAASPVAAGVDPALVSANATVDELEAIGRRQLERVEDVLANGSPNLPSLLLRLGDDPLAATDNYTEGYRLLNGEVMPYYAGFEDDILADPAATEGAEAAYELEEFFRWGEEDSAGEDHYFLTRLFAFPDEAAATDFMAGRPDALATGGFLLATGATDEASTELLPGEATDLGDESLAFDFVRAFDDGWRVEGYEIYVRVGATVAAVSLEGPPDMPLDLVTELAAAQAACLEAGACPDALPVPDAFYAAPAATPEAATPAA
jgi:hypothetical protein